MNKRTPATPLASFIRKYTPAVQRDARASLAKMRKLLPGAVEMVYDNYNFLVIGFGPNERPSEAVFSIVLAPRHVTLCFIHGARLKDPKKLLRGGGNQVRNIIIEKTSDLDKPDVRNLMQQAIKNARNPIEPKSRRKLIIKSISAKQRSRRPSE